MNRKLLRRMHQLRSRLQDKSAANYQRAVQAVEAAEQALSQAQESLRGEQLANGKLLAEPHRQVGRIFEGLGKRGVILVSERVGVLGKAVD